MPTFNVGGTNYPFPENKEKKWGDKVTNWASAVSTQLTQVIGNITTITSPYTPVSQFATGLANISLILNDPYIYDPDLAITITPISTERVSFFISNLDPLLPSFSSIQTDGELFVQIRKDGVAVFESKVGFDAIGQAFLPMNFSYTEILTPGSYGYEVGLKFEGTAGICDIENINFYALGGRI